MPSLQPFEPVNPDLGSERRPVPGCPVNVEATETGFLVLRGVPLSLYMNNSGYLTAYLPGRGPVNVHAAICEAWHGPPFEGADAAHKNGARWDNRPDNLEWKTKTENAADRQRHGTHKRGADCKLAAFSEREVRAVRALSARGASSREIARIFGVNRVTAWRAATGRTYRSPAANSDDDDGELERQIPIALSHEPRGS